VIFFLEVYYKKSPMNIETIWDQVKNQQTDIKNELEMMKNIKNINLTEQQDCCEFKYTTMNEGYEVCDNCGVVSQTKILEDNVYTFSNGENNMFLRTFSSYLFPVSSNSTMIAGHSNIARLTSWNSMPYNEKVLWEVQNEIKAKLGLLLSDKIITESLVLFKQLYEKANSFRGNNKKGFVAVCVYIASSMNYSPISPKEIANALGVELKAVYKCIQKYSEIMGESRSVSSADFLNHFCNKLGLEFKIQKRVLKILRVVEDCAILSSSTPQNICLSAIIFVCKEMKLEFDTLAVCEEFAISPSTLDKLVTTIQKEKKYILQQCVKNKK
jgi:transcription initiation factor TFIIIB Brf1 subunit/transcription initiation factor TFIIB